MKHQNGDKNRLKKIRYLLILIDKMPIQGPAWLKNVVLDRLYPEKGTRKPYRDYVDSQTKIEALEVGEQNFGDWHYASMAAAIHFQTIWDHKIDFDKFSWQPFSGRIGKGAVIKEWDQKLPTRKT